MLSSPLFRFFAGTDVFLSYRWSDSNKRYALRLTEELEKRGLNCYIDEKGLSRGDIVPNSLRKAIQKSKMLVVLASNDLNASTWVPKELALAQEFNRKIVPINVDHALDRMALDDPRWAPLKDRSRVEETEEAIVEGVPSSQVPAEIDGAYDFTRRRVVALRVLFLVGLIFFGLSIGAIASAWYAVRVRDNARREIGELNNKAIELKSQITIALNDKAVAEADALQAQKDKDTALGDRDKAIGEKEKADGEAAQARLDKAKAESDTRVARAATIEQTKLTADQQRLKSYLAAMNDGDRTSAFLSVREFDTDDRTQGWKEAAVSALQAPLPIWQADERILRADSIKRRFVSFTPSRQIVVHSIDDPQESIQLGGLEPIIENGFNPGSARVDWSNDGNYLALRLQRRLGVWSLRHPEKPVMVVDNSFFFAFSPLSNLLAFAREDVVEFWSLGDRPAVEGQQTLKGSIAGIWWSQGNRLLCRVDNSEEKSGEPGLYEVGPHDQIKLVSGFYPFNYDLTNPDQIVTWTVFPEGPPRTEFHVRSASAKNKSTFDFTIPSIAGVFRASLITAGEGGRFVLVPDKNQLWFGDMKTPGAAPVDLMTFSGDPLPKEASIRPLLNNQILVFGRESEKLYLFSLEHPSEVKVLKRDPKLREADQGISPDGLWWISSDGLFDFQNSKWLMLPDWSPINDYSVEDVTFSPDGRRAAAHIKGTARLIIIDLAQPTKLVTIDQPGTKEPGVRSFVVWGNPASGEILTASGGIARLWRLATGRGTTLGNLPAQFPLAVSSSGDLAWLKSGGNGEWQLQAWRIPGTSETLPFTEFIESLAINEEKTKMVAITNDLSEDSRENIRLQYWALKNTARSQLINTSKSSFKFASVSRDSLRALAIHQQGEPILWEPPFDKPLAVIPAGQSFSKGYLSDNGNFAALFNFTFPYQTIEVWDLSNLRQPIRKTAYTVPEFGNETFEMAISNDGKTVVAFGRGLSYLFTERNRAGVPLEGSEYGTRHLEFSPSGERIVATLYSGEAAVWTLAQPEVPELVLSDFSSLLGLARFGKTDNQVITLTDSGDMRVWDTSSDGLRNALNQTGPLCMTLRERQKYFGIRQATAVPQSGPCKDRKQSMGVE